MVLPPIARLSATLAALILALPSAAVEPLPPATDPWPPPPAAPPPERPAPPLRGGFRTELGGATLVFNRAGDGDVRQDGVALAFRSRTPALADPRFAANVNVTLGFTDWARAKEWIDAGNDAGSWTTDRFGDVAEWVEEGGDAQGIRLVGAFFADIFLALSYVAVPVCYAGSPAGAVSHLQMDVTASYDLADGPFGVWIEGGAGIMALPVRFFRWDYAAGPVVGLGLDAGPFSFVGRLLWAPEDFTSSERAGVSVVAASLTAGVRFR